MKSVSVADVSASTTKSSEDARDLERARVNGLHNSRRGHEPELAFIKTASMASSTQSAEATQSEGHMECSAEQI